MSPSRSSCQKDVEASLRGGGKHPGHRGHHARPRPKAMDETRGSWPALRTRVRKRPASVGARRPKTKVGACREAGGEKLHRRVAQPPHGRQCERTTPLLLSFARLSFARTLSATIDRRREAVVTLADPKTLRHKESKRAARLLYAMFTTQKETTLRGRFG